ncbi:pilus assembly protein PilP [Natronospirillum operosum]|uniref:Pilus assembly protein PilP n=1 Tax=Natronospirillum operosum TaxID=2759953 RepID=A0A4Z0WFL6_9GAMM|nr:type 4a pilus biogenesis protein PilO [Natronospirillum operosum]TGG93280.1 pilus assembly protein PilP [Natronospirillum operosum]
MSLKDSLQQLQDFDFNNIEWERMGVWPAPVKVLFVLLIMGAILTIGYFLLLKPAQENLQRVQAEESRLMDDYESKAFQVANLEEYREQLQSMRETFETVLRQLPDDTEIPDLLVDINDTAEFSGLTVNELSIDSPEPEELFIEQPLNLEAVGGYHEIGAFVSGMSALPRIVTLHNFSLEPTGDQGSAGPRLRLRIDVKTYQYRDAAEDR